MKQEVLKWVERYIGQYLKKEAQGLAFQCIRWTGKRIFDILAKSMDALGKRSSIMLD